MYICVIVPHAHSVYDTSKRWPLERSSCNVDNYALPLDVLLGVSLARICHLAIYYICHIEHAVEPISAGECRKDDPAAVEIQNIIV